MSLKMPKLLGRGGLALKTLYKLMGGVADFQTAVALALSTTTAGAIHALADVAAFVLAEDLPSAIALANKLQAALLAHFNEVASSAVPGAHFAADTTHYTALFAVPGAIDLPTCETLANAIQAAINPHLTAAGVHFHNDPTAVDATLAAADLSTTIALLNAMSLFVAAHFGRATFSPGFTR